MRILSLAFLLFIHGCASHLAPQNPNNIAQEAHADHADKESNKEQEKKEQEKNTTHSTNTQSNSGISLKEALHAPTLPTDPYDDADKDPTSSEKDGSTTSSTPRITDKPSDTQEARKKTPIMQNHLPSKLAQFPNKFPNKPLTVYLTIDDGFYQPSLFLDYLTEKKIPAVLFLTGKAIELHAHTWQKYFKSPLFALGNHTMYHKNSANLSPSMLAKDLDQWMSVSQKNLAPCANTSLFRFPYGSMGTGDTQAGHLRLIKERNMTPYLWQMDLSNPFGRSDPSIGQYKAQQLLASHLEHAIVLLHFNHIDYPRLIAFIDTLEKGPRPITFKLLPSAKSGCMR